MMSQYNVVKDTTDEMVILNSRSETKKGLWTAYKIHFLN